MQVSSFSCSMNLLTDTILQLFCQGSDSLSMLQDTHSASSYLQFLLLYFLFSVVPSFATWYFKSSYEIMSAYYIIAIYCIIIICVQECQVIFFVKTVSSFIFFSNNILIISRPILSVFQICFRMMTLT